MSNPAQTPASSVKPYKPWRITNSASGEVQERRGEMPAYACVGGIVANGGAAKIEHWEDGRWVLFEIICPDCDGTGTMRTDHGKERCPRGCRRRPRG